MEAISLADYSMGTIVWPLGVSGFQQIKALNLHQFHNVWVVLFG